MVFIVGFDVLIEINIVTCSMCAYRRGLDR
jgi:hypothetical protein